MQPVRFPKEEDSYAPRPKIKPHPKNVTKI